MRAGYFAGYRFAISLKNPSFSISFKKLRWTNCSGLAICASGVCGASMLSTNCIPLGVGQGRAPLSSRRAYGVNQTLYFAVTFIKGRAPLPCNV